LNPLRARKNEANQRYKARLRGEAVAYRTAPWTGREILALSDLYAKGLISRDGQIEKLAKQLGRTAASVACKAHDLGLTASRYDSLPQPDSTRLAVSLTRERELQEGRLVGGHRGRGGRRADLGYRYFRSAWEANYARYLNWSKVKWEYEVKTFRFESIRRGVMSYTPDFWLPDAGEYHEVKGWMTPRSATALSRMARFYPDVKVVVIDKAWFRVASRGALASVVPNWEGLGL
jgi:hypothetical protein